MAKDVKAKDHQTLIIESFLPPKKKDSMVYFMHYNKMTHSQMVGHHLTPSTISDMTFSMSRAFIGANGRFMSCKTKTRK
jgi:hypothetical protein